MFKAILLLSCAVLAKSQNVLVAPRVDYADNAAPTPYQFSYTAPAEGGSSSHQESGDGNGRVTGSYTVDDEDGRSRIVEYVADEDGFRASISTNEPGTANQNPADVTIATSADDGSGGVPVLTAPRATAAAVSSGNPVAVGRLTAQPAPQPARSARPALVPIQPAFVPAQPALFQAQPAFAPAQPAFVPAQPALVPVQPRLVPVQPSLVPVQPALVPVQPNFTPRRFFFEPSIPPFSPGRYIPRPSFPSFDSRRFFDQPVLVPVDNARSVPDPFFGRSFFRPFERDFLL